MEVNNGRYLTLMDFGRFEYFRRLKHLDTGAQKTKWGGAVAGASVRYRRRLHLFQKIKLATQLVALDERWWYFGQTVEHKDNIHVSALIRFAVTDRNGSVKTERLEKEWGITLERRMPDWVDAWDKSDQVRPWVSMAELSTGSS